MPPGHAWSAANPPGLKLAPTVIAAASTFISASRRLPRGQNAATSGSMTKSWPCSSRVETVSPSKPEQSSRIRRSHQDLSRRRNRPHRERAGRAAASLLATSHGGGVEMPRQRPRRRRHRAPATASQARAAADHPQMERVETRRRWWLPTAGIVTAMGLGIWIGSAFTAVGGVAEQAALWIGVLMAGLGGGRLFRRSLQRRRDRER